MYDPQSPNASPGAPQAAPGQPAPTTDPMTSAGPEPATEPVAWTAATFAAPVAPQPSPSAAARRAVGPGFVLTAVVAAAVLASGGTYLAVSAAGVGRATATETPVITPAVAGGTQTPAANGSPSAPAAAAPVAPAGGQTSVVEIVKAVSPAVVTIVAEGVTETDPTTGQTGQGTATGSGVIFDANGLILTNHHVVEGNPSKLTVHLKDGRTFDATVYGVDSLTDLAIVKVNQTGLPTAPIGDSSTIQVGQTAIAIGSPLGEFTDSVTSGIISAIGRSIPVQGGQLTNLIQTDTAINPGNSGGPLLDPSGKVIGINTAVAGGSQGIGFAIPIDIARPLLAQASAGQPLARPWLGIRFETIDPTVKKDNSLPVDNGAWIPSAAALAGQGSTGVQDPNAQGGQGTDPFGQGLQPNGGGGATSQVPDSVVAGGPAAQAGLKAGDIITKVEGTTLDASHPLDLVMSQYEPGKTVALEVLRNGQTSQVSVTLGTRPTDL